eukprot:comp21669_c0_seq1/m.30487 comp21669_c0_seq1/g.30487  ORF comp21669_c0_seq1/g.30487 comp21669_c0_seq1/m.30487 type:complete len:260 (-) comp21669_c0_seq1:102-881(-)
MASDGLAVDFSLRCNLHGQTFNSQWLQTSEVEENGNGTVEVIYELLKNCPVCYEGLVPANVAHLPSCGHSYCLSCILRWSKVKKSCPLCHTQFHHVLSHFQLDGSFDGSVLTTNLVNLMSQVRWLDLEFIEPCDLEPPLMRYQPESIIVEEDAFGTYTLDQFDEDYDPHSFAPSRGKEGRLRKHHAGCVSLAGQGKSVGPNRNQPPRRNSYPQSSSPPGSSMDAQSSGQTPEKLGRRARRALMRKQADERAAGGATVGN